MNFQILIQANKKIYEPKVLDDVQWVTERSGAAGKLTFKAMQNKTELFEEGNAVSLTVDGKKVFYGFIFIIKCDDNDVVSVTAYDQLRYLKNKTTYKYSLTASNLIKKIAKDFQLRCGIIEDTKYKIPSRIEDGKSLFDIVKNALDLTLANSGSIYVLYDDFGKLTLKGLKDMYVKIAIDSSNAQTFTYSSSIDDNTYNQIKLYYDNQDSGKRETYIVKDSKNINKWGLLQFYDKIEKGENGKAKAESLLKLYNSKTKRLTINNALGDIKVRGGSLIYVKMTLLDVKVNSWMLVESCTHTFRNEEHWMTLKLRGGEINSA